VKTNRCSLFSLFYRHGGDAVSLFSVFRVYLLLAVFQGLAQREISGKQFFMERFSRIYHCIC
jgi:hypothetical protein